MANLTTRTELSATPADGDLVHVVDVSDTTDNASGTSKKITVTNLLSWIASATMTLTNKTVTTPTLTLKQSTTPTPTAEGDIQWDTDNNQIAVGDGVGTKVFSDDSANASTYAAASHNHAASEVTSGTLAHERGGLEADVSAYSGLVKISAGSTSAVTAPTGTVVGTSDTQTLTNKTIDGDSNTITNLDLGNEVDWAVITDVSDASAFTTGDKILIFEAGVGMRKVDFSDLPGAAGGLTNIVEDTTPQLGGELDAQGNNITDLGDVTFQTGASGGTLRTGTSAADKFTLQAYDVDGTAYTTMLELDAGNTPVITFPQGIDLGASKNLTVNSTAILSDSAGTMTLSNIDALDATTEATIEAALDTLSNVTTVGTLTSGNADAIVSAASTTTAGKVEIATSAEINTGTDATRAVSPDALAGSNLGIRYVSVTLNGSTALTTSDLAYFRIPAGLTGMNLVSVAATVGTGAAGSSSSGTPTFTVKNVTDANQMLSTNLTVDANEYTSATAATAAVINTATDDVVTDDLIEVACTVAGTGVTYATVTLGFQLP